ncbi:MAG: alpha-glycosidase [Limnochordia bacterium]|jgi:cyclomaltodextrinase|nr:alpha-glycosidase [Bacillota bacterium]NLL07438.1 alpha-glycosidase [Bacillota bacterium]
MLREAVHHTAHGSFAYPVSPDTLRLTLRAARGDLQRAAVLYWDRYGSSPTLTAEMSIAAEDDLFTYYQADVQLATRRFGYVFLLDDGKQTLFYTEKGFCEDLQPNIQFHYPYIAPGDLWEPPEWAQGAVVYQIFPERFANGDPTNDPPDVEGWEEAPTPASFKGGDLQGIIDRFQHLVDLGVDVLYLTPIFKSPSNHKYDTADYYTIDPHFGDEETLRKLIALCRKHGIRIVLDAVFNHCGSEFFAFQDVLKHGARSSYAHWFNIEGFPVQTDPPNYETFAHQIATMPKLMTQHEDVKRYLLEVAVYWIREFSIDGWRLDVANELDHEFWREFRRAVKRENPDALIVGEVWHEASDWLRGDQFDSVMNYPFQHACFDFFAKGTIRARSFASRLAKVQVNHCQAVNLAMFNLLGSHDTERFLTSCGGDLRKYALAVAFQLTYEGAPMIYYGDEVGMTGLTDPDCRRGMVWSRKEQNGELLRWYKQLIALRREHRALRTGRCRTVWADSVSNVYGFVRFQGREQIVVLLNNSPQPQTVNLREINWPVKMPRQVRDLLSDERFKLGELVVPAYGVRILA